MIQTGPRQTTLCGLALSLFLLMLLATDVVVAGSFSVSPVRASLSPEARVVALRVHNSGSEPASVQAELMAWSQQNGEEQFEPSREVLVTPPIFTVPPGETQVIRIGLRRPPSPDTELSYRLFLQELPPPIPDNFQGLRVVTRMSLPVFVAPASGAATPGLNWRARRGMEGELLITARNDGNGHGQITELHLQLGGDRKHSQRGNTYVLPGAEHNWSIASEGEHIAPGSALVLTARVNGNDSTTRLRVE